MSYTVTIHFTNTDRTYEILRSGWTLPQTVGAKGKHATQSLNLSILSAEAFALFATEQQRTVKAEVKKDGIVIFQGVVRPYLTTSASGIHEDAVSLELLDYTELLHYYIKADDVLESKKLSEVIDELFFRAGVDVARSYPSEFFTTDTFYIPLTEGEYIDEVLSTLLYERGYDYRFTATECEFFATTTEIAPSATIKDIRGTLSVQRDDDWSEGLTVTYPKAKEDDVVIYKHRREESDPRNVGGTAVSYPGGTKYVDASGAYYDGAQHFNESTPPSGKAQVSWNVRYNEKTDANIKLLGITNAQTRAWMDDETGVSLTPHLENVTLSTGRLWLNYSGNFDYHSVPIVSWFGVAQWSWIWNIEVKAHVMYLVDNSVEVASQDGERPKNKESLSYIYTEADAQTYVQREVKRQKTSGFTYSFKSLTSYTAGSFYKLHDSITSINQVVRILSCNQNADGTYNIKAESASTMAISDISIQKLYYSDMENAGDTAFKITASKDVLEYDTDSSTLTLSGVITGSDEIIFKWALGSTELGTGKTLVVSAGQLENGSSTITCTAYLNNEQMAQTSYTLTRAVGKDGSSVEVQYSYSPSPDFCYDEAIQWSGSNVYWGTEQALWDTWIANAPEEKDGQYIWLRARVGNGSWNYTRLTGVQAKIYKLSCSQTNLTRNERIANSALYVTVYADIQGYADLNPRLLMNGTEVELGYSEDEGYYYVHGYTYKTATALKFDLYNGSDLMDSLSLGVIDKTAEACYFGVLESAPSQLTETESLLAGDWYLNENENVVYIYNGATWDGITESTYETGDFSGLEKVSVALADMIKLGTNGKTTATILGVFHMLCADEAFIKALETHYLKVGQGNTTSGFYTEISDTDEGMKFVVKYDGARVFEIEPSTGNVDFGQTDDGSPVFQYRASDKSIRSYKDALIISSDGSLEINDGLIKGSVAVDGILETKTAGSPTTIIAQSGSSATGVSGSQIKNNITNRANATLSTSTPASVNALSANGNVMGCTNFDRILRYNATGSSYVNFKTFTGSNSKTTETFEWVNSMPFAVAVASDITVKRTRSTVVKVTYSWQYVSTTTNSGIIPPEDTGSTSETPTRAGEIVIEISNVSQTASKPPTYTWTETKYKSVASASTVTEYTYGGVDKYLNGSQIHTSGAITVPSGSTLKFVFTGADGDTSNLKGEWKLNYKPSSYPTGIYLYKSDFSAYQILGNLTSDISTSVSNSLTVNGTTWLDCPLNSSTAWTYDSTYGGIYKLMQFAFSTAPTASGTANLWSNTPVAKYSDINGNSYNAGTLQTVTYTTTAISASGTGNPVILKVGDWVSSYEVNIVALTTPKRVEATTIVPFANQSANLGTSTQAWEAVYAKAVYVQNSAGSWVKIEV